MYFSMTNDVIQAKQHNIIVICNTLTVKFKHDFASASHSKKSRFKSRLVNNIF